MSTSGKSITLYTWGTQNGWKASILLEELGLEYEVVPINLSTREQKQEWFLKINPNGKIPAIVDHTKGDFAVFESGAIMLYLGENYDTEHRLLPADPLERSKVLQWLMFHMGGVGPMQGQANYFVLFAPEEIPFVRKHFLDETKRLYGVLERGLTGQEYLANNKYSVADIANWCLVKWHSILGIDISEFPNVASWLKRIEARRAVQRGAMVPNDQAWQRLAAKEAENRG